MEKLDKKEKNEINKRKTEETNNFNEQKKRKIIFISLVSVIVILVILVCITGFAIANLGNNKIISNVKINNISVEGLTKEEANKVVTEQLNSNLEKDIIFVSENFEYSIKLSQIETKYNIEKAVEDAYNIGRSGNIFKNNFIILRSMIDGNNVNVESSYNEELLNNIVNEISIKIPNAVEQSSYFIENDTLIIKKGKSGNSIEKETAKQEIINRINGNNNEKINLTIIYTEPDKIDIDKIYSEVHKEAKDAYYTKDPFKVYPHVDGVDFDLEAARELLKEDKEEYEIKLTIISPEITTNKIGTEAFPDLLSTFSTKYDASNINRSTNLVLAAQKINGTVLMPGETFSYNNVVGERTMAKGYREANGFSGGKVVGMIGGGICQIASTLYDAVIYANLEIVDRTNHAFSAGYVGAGRDATVSYGTIDFKFKNTRNNPIMIKMYASNGIAKADIYGIKEDVEYEIDIETTILSYMPYSVIYETDNSLAPGQQKVYQNGMQGMKSITYKVTKLNGKEISRTVLSNDTYSAMNKIILQGPEVANNEPEQEQIQEETTYVEPEVQVTVETNIEPIVPEQVQVQNTET